MQSASGVYYSPWQLIQTMSQQLSQMHQLVNEQQQEICGLGSRIDALDKRLQAAEERPLYHIDNLSYHFDQLKVEKLEGTLNIGMTPPGGEQLEQIGQLVTPETPSGGPVPVPGPGPGFPSGPGSVGAENMPGGKPQTSGPNEFPFTGAPSLPSEAFPGSPYPEIKREVDNYLNQLAYRRIRELEAEYGVSLDPFHQRLVIEDLRKQMSERIQFYLRRAAAGTNGVGALPLNSAETFQQVYANTVRDIEIALRAYLSKLREQSQQQQLQQTQSFEGGPNGPV